MADRGFAVVANQVSNLAQQSTEASQNISVLIEGTLQAVAESVRLATAEESTAASQELNHQAEVLKEMVSKFKMN